MRNLNTNC